jgi:hypothetical protein
MKTEFTTPSMGANIKWLQNMSSLVGQLCSRVAVVTLLQFVCVRRHVIIMFSKTRILDFFLITWVQIGSVEFEIKKKQNIPHVKINVCSKRWLCCVSGTSINK